MKALKIKEKSMNANLFLSILYLVNSLHVSAALAEDRAMDIADLQGKWKLESINEQPISSKQNIYFQIDGTTITGFDGCNNFGGSLSDPPQLRRGQRACISEGPRLPLELSNPLPQLNAAKLNGDELNVPLPNGSGKAKFKRQ